MAKYNEILVGHFNRMLTKLLGMKGESPAPQLASEITPALPMFSGTENRFLAAWDRFQSSDFQAAVAAQPSTIRFRNPAGSNVVIVIESIVVIGDAAVGDQYIFERNSAAVADLATIIAPSAAEPVDARTVRQRTAIISSQAAANQSTNMVQIGGGSGPVLVPYQFVTTDVQELQVLPGTAVQVRRVTVNVALTVAWLWRERYLEESERQ